MSEVHTMRKFGLLNAKKITELWFKMGSKWDKNYYFILLAIYIDK